MTRPASAPIQGLASKARLYATVFLAGASVMMIELLGTRLVAPFYGASLYVWSSLIAVTMMALAVGYYGGGRLADRFSGNGLSLIMALAGLLTVLIPILTKPVLLLTDSLGLRLGAFISALLLFSPSLIVLGMVGPFAIKQRTQALASLASNAGTLYAISTLGSVVGTLLLGFFIFPLLGSREILLGNGLLLVLLAMVLAIYEHRQRQHWKGLLCCVAMLFMTLALVPVLVSANQWRGLPLQMTVQSEAESLYGWVRVIDEPKRDRRLLTADGSAIGAARLSTGENLLSYQDIVGIIPALRPGMHKALVIGLGAGKMVGSLQSRYGLQVDSLEIDPAVAAAAKQYFNFNANGNTIIGDARYEIRHLNQRYDLIIHDCFTGGSEPAHLLTLETLQQLKGLLTENGVLAVNFIGFGSGPNASALASVARTLDAVFPQQAVFISEVGQAFADFIFLASQQPLTLTASSLTPTENQWLQQHRFTIDAQHAQLLTDNLNPLEQLQIAKSEHYRQVMLAWFGPQLLIR